MIEATTTGSSIHLRAQSNCALCPFTGKRKVGAEHPATAKLMLVGEAPGETEEQLGKPFSGASGRLLNWVISQVGLFRPALWITNVIYCRPPQNDISTIDGSDAIDACAPGFRAELEAAYDAGVRTILALGAVATKAFGITGAIHDVRGSVYTYTTYSGKKFNVIPTYHPAAIMRQHWKRSGGGTADAAVLWQADFRKAKAISEDGYAPYEERFNLQPTVADVTAFVEKAISSNALVAVDTETTGLSYDYARIVVIGLAVSPEDALSVPILTDHGRLYWKPEEWITVSAALNKLFQTCDQVYQNCFFDVPILRKNGFGVPFEKVLYDTLLVHHTLSPETKHDLATITSLYGKTPFWKSEFRDRETTILDMDQMVMRRYNLRDCVVLHQVLPAMLDDLRTLKLEELWHTEVHPLIPVVLEMTETGVGFSPSRMATYRNTLTAHLAALKTELLADMSLPDTFNLDSDDHIRWFLYGIEPTSFKHLPELATKKPGTKIYAELSGLKKVHDEGGPRYILPSWTPPKTDTGKPAVDKEGLLAYRIQLNNRLSTIKSPEEQSAIRRLLDWMTKLTEYNRIGKLLSTYTKYKPDLDGRIRPRWIIHGTVSGRLACRDPNLMNPPKPKDDPTDPASPVRSFFVAAPGNVFVSCDYINLEAQLLAFETEDPILCAVFEQGLNLHDLNTRSMFKIEPNNPRWKSARKAAKVFFFGGISYGGGDQTIYQKVYLEAPELNLTFADFKRAKDSWMRDHPAYVAWKNRIITTVMRDRELRTEFGRLRQFLGNAADIGKEALNFMIQSAGASLVNRASARIYARLRQEGLSAKFVLQIHDQLVLECPESEAESVKAIVVEEMERPFLYHGKPRRIPVEATIGPDFGAV